MEIEPKKQGDSLWVDYLIENWADFFATWDATWEGTFEISATATSTPIYTGTLTRSTTPGLFTLRLGYDAASTAPVLTWAAMPVGAYTLMAQLRNTTAKCQKEFHDKLVIQAQGL